MKRFATTRSIGLLLALVAVASFALDWARTAQGGALDLRNHVTGARLLAHGLDPYHYRWQPGAPVAFYDPVEAAASTVSRVTVTPAMLLLHLPVAALPYDAGRFAWLVLQWLCLLGIGLIGWRQLATARQRLTWALLLAGFTFTAIWRLHAERGQAYVLLALIFLGWLALTRAGGRDFVAGLLAGLLMALRPPCLFLLPFLALHRRGQLAGAAAGLGLFVALPMLFSAACWPDYFAAMQTHSWFYLHDNMPVVQVQTTVPDVEGVPAAVLAHRSGLVFTTFPMYRLLRHYGAPVLPGGALFLMVMAPFGLWLWLSRRQPLLELLTGLAAWFFLVDFFLPADRISYNDVLILPLLAFGLVDTARLPWGQWLALLALALSGLVLARPYLNVSPNPPVLILVAASLVFLIFGACRPRTPGPAVPR